MAIFKCSKRIKYNKKVRRCCTIVLMFVIAVVSIKNVFYNYEIRKVFLKYYIMILDTISLQKNRFNCVKKHI